MGSVQQSDLPERPCIGWAKAKPKTKKRQEFDDAHLKTGGSAKRVLAAVLLYTVV